MPGFFIFIFLMFAAMVGVALLKSLAQVTNWHSSSNSLDLISRVFSGQTIQPKNDPAYTLIRSQGTLYKVSMRSGAGNGPRQFLSISSAWSGPDEPKQFTKDGELFRMSLTLERVERQNFRIRNRVRVPDLELGDPEFDRCFYIRSNDLDKVPTILNSRAQHLIHEIYRVSKLQRFEMRVTGDQLQLDTGLLPDSPNSRMFKAIRLFIELHRTMVDSSHVIGKIEIEEMLLQDTVCLICGDVVDDPSVTCNDCQTAYHLDCWKYVAQCGRYACGGTRFTQNVPQSEMGKDLTELYRIDE